jgi:hypothetical protein
VSDQLDLELGDVDNFGNSLPPIEDRPVGNRDADELREALRELSDDLDYYVGTDLTRDQLNAAAQLVRLALGHL